MKRIAILYICIGEYIRFWDGFFRSFEANFLTETHREYFVFTDAPTLPHADKNPRVHKIFQRDLGWPGDTLQRYDMFLQIEDELRSFDYCFFFNANCVCQVPILPQEVLPKTGIVVTTHPGFYNWPSWQFTYERRRESQACIPWFSLRGKHYVCGGVNGGTAAAFLEMARVLKERIDKDAQRGITAIWHDESHLNRYVADLKEYKLLSPDFAYPEDWDIPFECKILLLDKQKYIPLAQAKTAGDSNKTGDNPQEKQPGPAMRWILRGWEKVKRLVG